MPGTELPVFCGRRWGGRRGGSEEEGSRTRQPPRAGRPAPSGRRSPPLFLSAGRDSSRHCVPPFQLVQASDATQLFLSPCRVLGGVPWRLGSVSGQNGTSVCVTCQAQLDVVWLIYLSARTESTSRRWCTRSVSPLLPWLTGDREETCSPSPRSTEHTARSLRWPQLHRHGPLTWAQRSSEDALGWRVCPQALGPLGPARSPPRAPCPQDKGLCVSWGTEAGT